MLEPSNENSQKETTSKEDIVFEGRPAEIHDTAYNLFVNNIYIRSVIGLLYGLCVSIITFLILVFLISIILNFTGGATNVLKERERK